MFQFSVYFILLLVSAASHIPPLIHACIYNRGLLCDCIESVLLVDRFLFNIIIENCSTEGLYAGKESGTDILGWKHGDRVDGYIIDQSPSSEKKETEDSAKTTSLSLESSKQKEEKVAQQMGKTIPMILDLIVVLIRAVQGLTSLKSCTEALFLVSAPIILFLERWITFSSSYIRNLSPYSTFTPSSLLRSISSQSFSSSSSSHIFPSLCVSPFSFLASLSSSLCSSLSTCLNVTRTHSIALFLLSKSVSVVDSCIFIIINPSSSLFSPSSVSVALGCLQNIMRIEEAIDIVCERALFVHKTTCNPIQPPEAKPLPSEQTESHIQHQQGRFKKPMGQPQSSFPIDGHRVLLGACLKCVASGCAEIAGASVSLLVVWLGKEGE
ncbi:hypothetical protein ADUPG1_013005, partial [Aduncisulcus paluster]